MSNHKASSLTPGRLALIAGAMLCLFTLTVGLNARTRPLLPEECHQFEFPAQGQGRRSITEINESGADDSQTHIRYSDGDHTLEIKAKESLEFTDDDADIKSVSPGGYLLVEEARGGLTRKWEVRRGADGRPQSSYYLRGQEQPLDREARAWLAEVLPDVIRNTAIGARARVRRIYRQRGAGGVLDEISLIKSDGAKRIYFRELFNNGNMDATTLRRAARQIGGEIHSDGEKAALLIESADLFLVHQSIAPDLFAAVGSISSDGEHKRVLSAMLKKNLNDENVLRALKSARAISSDGEKANLLIQHTDVFLNHQSSLQSFFETTDSLNSDGEHARVLNALIKRQGLSRENLLRAIRSAARISSDGEKANVLVHAARVYASDETALSAIAEAARTINSDGEKSRVLTAIVRHGQRP